MTDILTKLADERKENTDKVLSLLMNDIAKYCATYEEIRADAIILLCNDDLSDSQLRLIGSVLDVTNHGYASHVYEGNDGPRRVVTLYSSFVGDTREFARRSRLTEDPTRTTRRDADRARQIANLERMIAVLKTE